MSIKEYKELIFETAQYPIEVNNFGLAYATLGLLDEIEEVKEKILEEKSIFDVRHEIGDVLWYVAAISKEAELSFEEIIFKTIEEDHSPSSSIAGMVKKFYRDNKPIDKEKITNSIINQLIEIFQYYTSLYETMSIEEEIEYIMTLNKIKLLNRRANNTIKGDGDYR